MSESLVLYCIDLIIPKIIYNTFCRLFLEYCEYGPYVQQKQYMICKSFKACIHTVLVEQNYHVETQQVNSLGQYFPYFPLYSYLPKLNVLTTYRTSITRTATARFQIEDEVLKKSSANKHNPSPVQSTKKLKTTTTTTRGRICLSI